MDRNPLAVVFEAVKNIYGICIIYWQGDWFGAGAFFSWAKYLIFAYLIIATVITALIALRQYKEDIMAAGDLGYHPA